jgi:D-alanyl-D-alanine carboxypeptidase
VLLVTILFCYEIYRFKIIQVTPFNQTVQNTQTRLTLLVPNPPQNTDTAALFYPFSFEDNEFVQLFYTIDLNNVQELDSPPPITQDAEVDAHIVSLATARGYRLQRIATTNNLVYEEGILLQQDVKQAWQELLTKANQSGISFTIVSGYRSVEDQRYLFLSRFRAASVQAIGREYTKTEITSGKADATIQEVLQYSSIPGFSKHHSGYALDINDASSATSFTQFSQTKAYDWLVADNYYHARQFGFVPSYPEEATHMGPEAEAWEFVWVGKDIALYGTTNQ